MFTSCCKISNIFRAVREINTGGHICDVNRTYTIYTEIRKRKTYLKRKTKRTRSVWLLRLTKTDLHMRSESYFTQAIRIT